MRQLVQFRSKQLREMEKIKTTGIVIRWGTVFGKSNFGRRSGENKSVRKGSFLNFPITQILHELDYRNIAGKAIRSSWHCCQLGCLDVLSAQNGEWLSSPLTAGLMFFQPETGNGYPVH
ncbi:hypothetical protein SLA2020_491770 [Shorea laevis]